MDSTGTIPAFEGVTFELSDDIEAVVVVLIVVGAVVEAAGAVVEGAAAADAGVNTGSGGLTVELGVGSGVEGRLITYWTLGQGE